VDTVEELNAVATTVKPGEMKLAQQAIATFNGPLDLADYKDEYREGLQRTIDAKIAGEEIVFYWILLLLVFVVVVHGDRRKDCELRRISRHLVGSATVQTDGIGRRCNLRIGRELGWIQRTPTPFACFIG
jgi:hypothetical protein